MEMPQPQHDNGGSPVSLREVYSLVESVRAELLAEMKATKTSIDALLTKHDSEHKAHDELHERDAKDRRAHVRWAVTSIIAIAGVIVAIYVAFQTRTIQIGE